MRRLGSFRGDENAPQQFWILSEQYFPQETATGYLLTSLAEALAQDIPVNVICLNPGMDVGGKGQPAYEQRNHVHIYRSRATTFDKNWLPLRMINILTGSLALFFRTLRMVHKRDVVLVVTNPPALPFFVHGASWMKGGKTILLIYDVYPEAAIAAGVLDRDGVWVKVLNWMNRMLYRSVDSIIVLGRDMRELVIEKLAGTNKIVDVIPNWADLDQISPQPTEENALLKQLGLEDKFVIQYAGNMARVNDVESIIEAADILRHNEDIHFLFIGDGAKWQWVEQSIQERQLKNVKLLPRRPRHEQNEFLNACTIGVISLNPGMKGVSVPSRSYNIMAAGKPILAIVEPGTEIDRVIQGEGIGWSVPPRHPDLLAKTISHISSQPSYVSEKGRKARRLAESRYSLDAAFEEYRSVIRGALSKA